LPEQVVDCRSKAIIYQQAMGARRRSLVSALLVIIVASCGAGASAAPDNATEPFGENFEIMGAEDHVKTSADGKTWYLYLDNHTGE
jgi:xyloglucan:xyloglucosyl transferase